MANQETWDKQILNSLKRIRKTTIAGSLGGSEDINDRTTWQLYEFTPNRDLDQKQRHYLAGPEWSIISCPAEYLHFGGGKAGGRRQEAEGFPAIST
ncbi:hypothetical protein [Okeania sp. SIO1I7]|uniref:hypothetical protein n=1 Tax=Okeania sp. SIO1I7 TaxID=2607772 RepID=UPI0013F87123|nr:hypothetical protein [Okeania sp. SIO1I7]NET24698.1 hypothetical protein [Okeania sp. SIO1I7]